MPYRCVTTSIEGFVQQIACSYLRHGYWWYVTGIIPHHKPVESIDAKLLERYDIIQSEWSRTRRKKQGLANMQYLRSGRRFVLLATKGEHEFFDAERDVLRDFRKHPLYISGYSISYRRGGRQRSGERDHKRHAHVELDRQCYRELKTWFENQALRSTVDALEKDFQTIPFEPYAPIRRQLLNVLRSVNRIRKQAGRAPLESSCLRLRRRILRPFESPVVWNSCWTSRLPESMGPDRFTSRR